MNIIPNNIVSLKGRGFLTEQQFLTAMRFLKNPCDFKLSPTLFRVLHDLIIKDTPLVEYENKRGWPARSAKLMLSQLLYALEETQGIWWGDDDMRDEGGSKELTEKIEYLTGTNVFDLSDSMHEFTFSVREARIFLVLKKSLGRSLTRETILTRAYDGISVDEQPNEKTIDVHVCKIRKKVKTKFRIKTIRGVGYVMTETRTESEREI